MFKSKTVVLGLILSLFCTVALASHDSGNGNSNDHGPQGEPRVQGPAGPQGDPGPTGPEGPTGPAGQNGLDGEDGSNGLNGQDCDNEAFDYGPGVDVVVFKSSNPILSAVEVQGRYDVESNETRVYGVLKVDLWEAIKNKRR